MRAGPQGNLLEVGLGRLASMPAETAVKRRQGIKSGGGRQLIHRPRISTGGQAIEQMLQARLGISAQDWQNYWRKTAPQVAWLQQLNNLTPATKLPVSDILAAMNSVPKQSVVRSREALLQRLLQPSWSDVLENMGSGYRFKTYTWYHPSIMGAYFGGAAGWLADGRSFWLGGTGGSHAVLQKHAAQITQLLPPASQALDEGCVVVDYFARYPIAQVSVRGSGQAAPAGALRGTFAVKFANGQQLSVRSQYRRM